jgi:hypothetical protein
MLAGPFPKWNEKSRSSLAPALGLRAGIVGLFILTQTKLRGKVVSYVPELVASIRLIDTVH